MKFLNMTVSPHTEQDLTLPQIQSLIKLGTGRELVFENKKLSQNYKKLFKLVRMPDPIGYLLVANQDIPAQAFLFPYGGENITPPLPNREYCTKFSEYLLQSQDEQGNTLVQQGKLKGDLGTLAAHLPDEKFLKLIGLSESDYSKIQTANTEVVYNYVDRQARLFLVSTRLIKAGSVIGFSYDWEYWVERKTSPVFFTNNKLEILNASALHFDGMAVCCDHSGSPHLSNPDDPSIRKAVAVNLSFLAKQIGQRVAAPMVNSSRGLLVFNPDQVKNEIKANTDRDGKLTNVFLFFSSQHTVGCAPPPGSTIIDQRTIVPGST